MCEYTFKLCIFKKLSFRNRLIFTLFCGVEVCVNGIFPQNSHTRELDEISVFYAVQVWHTGN